MARGRKKTPTVLHIARGNPGKRPLNDLEPTPEVSIPDCPDHLDELAKKEWDWIATALEKEGLLTYIDKAALAMYCQSYARWSRAEQEIQNGAYFVKGAAGGPVTNPWLAIANRSMDQCHRLLREFGLSPTSRASLKIERDDSAVDTFQSYMNRKKA
jgi:P27 family predicted phage terminase small subunit